MRNYFALQNCFAQKHSSKIAVGHNENLTCMNTQLRTLLEKINGKKRNKKLCLQILSSFYARN